MVKVPIYNLEGKEVGVRALPDRIFGVSVSPALVEQAVVAQRAQGRATVAHTKTRAQVRGGGKKPWRQKGTGRARHGSIRSPIWKGGGVAHGPRPERNYSLKLNQKAKQKALFMVLSDKVASKQLVLVDKLELPSIKTKAFAQLLKKLPVAASTLLVLPAKNQQLEKSSRNIPGVTPIQGHSLNVVDVLRHRSLLMPEQAVEVIERTYRHGQPLEKSHGTA
ncbi:MAG: 50S ribosomal protein L4 [Candidatus Kerfeldbacteria bacterium]|nr:50S ribosomal protein L4 [Candidatus Kerfeldbacteria bacterium]